MSKPRILDHLFWKDKDIRKLANNERLLLIGMITKLADDFGRLDADAEYLHHEVFGFDASVSVRDVEGYRDSIVARCHNVLLYEVREQPYIWLSNFDKYQGMRWKADSKLPAHPDDTQIASKLIDKGEKQQQPQQPQQPQPVLKIVDGDEPKRETKTPRRAASPTVPYPADFAVTAELRQWAKDEHISEWIDIHKETRYFRDYWTIGEGQGKGKKNWLLTWKNWMRGAAEKAQARGLRLRNGNGGMAMVGDSDTPPEGYSYERDNQGNWIHLNGNPPDFKLPYGATTDEEVEERHKAKRLERAANKRKGAA